LASPLSAASGGVRIAIRLTPRGGRAGFDGLKPAVDGGVELGVRVTAPPEDGRANEALLRLLAKAWRCPAADLSLVQGATSRHKVIHRRGDGALLAAMETWLSEVVGVRKTD
jgi:uncharacterized protein (TIGR00251 family)